MTHLWEQRADYQQACNWVAPPGAITVYNPPRPVGRNSVTDVTDFHYGQSLWNEHNLPEVMYMLNPDDDWKAFKQSGRQNVLPITDPITGLPRYEQWARPGETPRILLDFPILRGINKIGTEEHWWWFEIIRRLDPRISYPDLIMRMEYTGPKRVYNETQYVNRFFNNRVSRTLRPSWGLLNWQGKFGGGAKTEAETRTKLSASQVQNNTTRGTTPGLTDPSRPEGLDNIRVPVPAEKKQGKRGPNKNKNIADTTAGSTDPPPPASLPTLRLKRRRTEEVEPANDEHTSGSAPRPKRQRRDQAQPPTGSAQGTSAPGDEGSVLSRIPTFQQQPNPYAYLDNDPEYVASLSAGFVNPRRGTMRDQLSYDEPLASVDEPDVPFPEAPSRLLQPTSSGRAGGDYRQGQSSTHRHSPSDCVSCGYPDPDGMHIVDGCPDEEPAMEWPLQVAAAPIDNNGVAPVDLDGMERFGHPLEQATGQNLEQTNDTSLGYEPPPGGERDPTRQQVIFSSPPSFDPSGRRIWSDYESS